MELLESDQCAPKALETAQRFERIHRALVVDRVVKPLAEKINGQNKVTMQRFPAGEYLVLTGAGGVPTEKSIRCHIGRAESA